MTTGGPEAGWYDIGDGVERRHDGTTWTDDRRPLGSDSAPAAPAIATAAPASYASDPSRSDMEALAESPTAEENGSTPSRTALWVRERKVPLLVLAGVAALAVGGFALGANDPVTGGASRPAAQSPLLQAVTGCGMSRGSAGVTLGDSDLSLVLDGRGDDDATGVSVEHQACVLAALDIPDSTLNLMSTTRALDGRQQGSWDGYEASWSYHPDTGLNVTLTRS